MDYEVRFGPGPSGGKPGDAKNNGEPPEDRPPTDSGSGSAGGLEGNQAGRRSARDDRREDRDHAPIGWSPFRIAIIAELQPRPDFALKCPVRLRPEVLSVGGYDRLLGRIEPAFRMNLKDPGTQRDLEVDVRWKQWADLGGAGLLASPAIASMVDARSSLLHGSPKQDPYQYVDRVLPGNAAWLPRNPAGAGSAGTDVASGPEANQAKAAPVKQPAPPEQGSDDPLGSLFDLVDLPSQPSAPSEPSGQQYRQAGAAVESALSQLLCAALEDLEYQRLRRVWQSLRFLLEAQGTNKQIEIWVVPSSGDLDELSQALDQLESLEIDLVVYEAPFEACARDAECLNFLGNWASSQNVPVIATLDASWFNRAAPNNYQPRLKLADSSRSLFETLTRRESARWLMLTANDLCEAEPLSGKVVRGGPECSQPRDRETSWAFIPAGVALSNLVLGSLERDGEPFFAENWGGAQLRSRAVYELNTDLGAVAIGTRWFCSEEMALDLGALGISVLAPEKNRDRVRVVTCPTAFRAANAAGNQGRPAATLQDQMLASRIVHLINSYRSRYNGDPDALREHLLDGIHALFPKSPPVGPIVNVTEQRGSIVVEVEPRRYGQLTIDQLSLSIPIR